MPKKFIPFEELFLSKNNLTKQLIYLMLYHETEDNLLHLEKHFQRSEKIYQRLEKNFPIKVTPWSIIFSDEDFIAFYKEVIFKLEYEELESLVQQQFNKQFLPIILRFPIKVISPLLLLIVYLLWDPQIFLPVNKNYNLNLNNKKSWIEWKNFYQDFFQALAIAYILYPLRSTAELKKLIAEPLAIQVS